MADARPTLSRELLLLLAALAAAAAVVTLTAAGFAVAGLSEPERAARKGLVPLVVICWLLLARVPRRGLGKALGLEGARAPAKSVRLGLLCGVAAMVLLNAGLFAMGAREADVEMSVVPLIGKAALYLLQALALAFLEETLFRGILHGRLRAAAGPAVAVVLGSAVFAAAHFLRPPKARPPEAWWDTIPACFAGMHDMLTERWREFVGLLLVGVVLAVLREGRRTIFLALGVHAGWVWVRFVSRKVIDEVDDRVDANPVFFGSMRLYDGAVGWCALLGTLALAWWLAIRSGGRGSAS